MKVAREGSERVDRSVWRDARFRAWSVDAKLLWFWVLTHEGVGFSGVFELNMKRAARETGMGPEQIDAAWAAILENPNVQYDDSYGAVWLVKRMGRLCKNADHWKGCARHVEAFSDATFYAAILARYPNLGLNASTGVGVGSPPDHLSGETPTPLDTPTDDLRPTTHDPRPSPRAGTREARGPKGALPSDFPEWFRTEWNATCARKGMKRRTAPIRGKLLDSVRARWKEHPERQAWSDALYACSKSEHWCGEGKPFYADGRPWVGAIESFLRPTHFDKFVNEAATESLYERAYARAQEIASDAKLDLPAGYIGEHPAELSLVMQDEGIEQLAKYLVEHMA